MHNGLYKQAACRSDSRIRHLFAEQGTHIALAVGQTSDSRIRPTRMMLPNCFYFVRLFFRVGIKRVYIQMGIRVWNHFSSICFAYQKGRLKLFQTAFLPLAIAFTTLSQCFRTDSGYSLLWCRPRWFGRSARRKWRIRLSSGQPARAWGRWMKTCRFGWW